MPMAGDTFLTNSGLSLEDENLHTGHSLDPGQHRTHHVAFDDEVVDLGIAR